MKKIGIFGGAFNPPHKGHVRLARDFADRLSLTEVLIMPSFIPPHKSAEALANAEDRLEMCRLAFCADKRFNVSAVEIERGGKSYTYDTLLKIREENPGTEIFLIIGSDMLLSFDTWRRYEDILKIATLCTAARENGPALSQGKTYGAIISDLPPLELSSTMIREKIKNGDDITKYTGGNVAAYIKTGGYTVIDLELIAGQKLTPARLEHTLRVADSAKELAGQYGADTRSAHTAAMLHDIMKDTLREEQLYLIEKSGIILTCADRASPKIWHAIAGAAYLRGELGIADGDIYNAVYYHTTGRAGMSLLEKVIYIADYVSTDRTYDGVEDMRVLAGESLEAAMLFALEFCIRRLARSRQVIHPDSVECFNELLIEKSGKSQH